MGEAAVYYTTEVNEIIIFSWVVEFLENFLEFTLKQEMVYSHRNNKVIFSLAWNAMFSDYWKVIDLNFLEMGNTVFLWSKKLMERWYLRGIFELSMIFQELGNMAFGAV